MDIRRSISYCTSAPRIANTITMERVKGLEPSTLSLEG